MKIQGNSKIISPQAGSSEVIIEQPTNTEVHIDKNDLEHLVSVAELDDLVHNLSPFQSKVKQVKEVVKNLIDKAKPYRDILFAKQKEFTAETIQKARDLSPHVDKLITAMDKSITYIADPSPLDGRSEVIQETRAPAVFGMWVMFITFGVFMMWAFIAPLDSASHAVGKIVLESKKRLIQHPEGGVIKDILVHDGDEVTQGQTLIILDDTQLRAKKRQHQYTYFAHLAEVARLTAEKDHLEEITFPEILIEKSKNPEVKKMIETQEKLFVSRKEAYASRNSQLEKVIEQAIERKNAIMYQLDAASKLVKITASQLESYKKLFKKGNLNLANLQEAESRYAQYLGQEGQLRSQLAENEHNIIQNQVAKETNKNDYFERIALELKETQKHLSISEEALKDVRASLNRTIITAPEAGIISNLAEHITPGGVLPYGQILMEIIPQDDKLVVEAKIKPEDIAAVQVGQVSRVRLTAYRARIVPVLEGRVTALSADVVSSMNQVDLQNLGPFYYKVRIEIDKEQLKIAKKRNDVNVYPGMGVDVMIVIGTRTMMQYLMDPITMTLDHAFKER